MIISLIPCSEHALTVGNKINRALSEIYKNPEIVYEKDAYKEHNLSDATQRAFEGCDAIVYIGATGIAVRLISKYLEHKSGDPAVVVIDDSGRFCISLLSGHVGGANELAELLAEKINAIPVITTASDVSGSFSPDVFAKNYNLGMNDWDGAKEIAAAALKGEAFNIFVSDRVVNREDISKERVLHLYPQNLILGIGCKKKTDCNTIENVVNECLRKGGYCLESVRCVCSIDIKKDEQGLIDFSNLISRPFVTFTAEEIIDSTKELNIAFSKSDFVKEVTGVDCVCEQSIFAAGAKRLLVNKYAKDGVTVAVGTIR